jgi:subtilisin family serine protease
MSAPHVTGTAALLVSILGRNPDAIKERIEESADQIGSIQVRGFYGNGRLNVARAVGAIP